MSGRGRSRSTKRSRTRTRRPQVCGQARRARAVRLLPEQRDWFAPASVSLVHGDHPLRASSARWPASTCIAGRRPVAPAMAASQVAPDAWTPTRGSTCASARPRRCSPCALRGFWLGGDNPDHLLFRRQQELRGYPYYVLLGQPGLLRQRGAPLPAHQPGGDPDRGPGPGARDRSSSGSAAPSTAASTTSSRTSEPASPT